MHACAAGQGYSWVRAHDHYQVSGCSNQNAAHYRPPQLDRKGSSDSEPDFHPRAEPTLALFKFL